MAGLRDIKKRISSVRNTQKITKAMKMVAAAKLRRAQQAVVGARPYATALHGMIADVAKTLPRAQLGALFEVRPVKHVRVLVFTSNRGLCGGFNSNLMRRTDQFLRDLTSRGITFDIEVVGRKGRDFLVARKYKVAHVYANWADVLTVDDASNYTETLVRDYTAQKFDQFYLIYNHFKSAISQEVEMESFLPLTDVVPADSDDYGIKTIFEPDASRLFTELLPRYMTTRLLRAHLESLASELGARMSAMDSATKNASEMIGLLTLRYNRARQAAITTELMDIVNGAESLNG